LQQPSLTGHQHSCNIHGHYTFTAYLLSQVWIDNRHDVFFAGRIAYPKTTIYPPKFLVGIHACYLNFRPRDRPYMEGRFVGPSPRYNHVPGLASTNVTSGASQLNQ
jgi:hypothetical protein